MKHIDSARQAIDYLHSLTSGSQPAIAQKNLSDSRGPFLTWLRREIEDLHQIAQESKDISFGSHVDRQRFQDLIEVFFQLEEQGDTLNATKDLGHKFCSKVISSLTTDKEFIHDFLCAISLDKRKHFELLVWGGLSKQLVKKNDGKGLQELASTFKDSDLSSSFKEDMDVLIQGLLKIEKSVKYEILAKADAYVRSGHARSDLEDESPDGRALREAFSQMRSATGKELKESQSLAMLELIKRFDSLFHVVKIKDNKTVTYGIATNQLDYVEPTVKNLRNSLKCAKSGYLDVAILQHGTDDKWIISTVTAATSAERIIDEGEQYTRHRRAFDNWSFVDPRLDPTLETPFNKKINTVSHGVVYPALINTNSKANKFLSQIKAQADSPEVQSINDLVLLNILSNRKNVGESEKIYCCCVGASVNPELLNSMATPDYSKVACNQIIRATTALLDNPQEILTAGADITTAIKLASQLLVAYKENPYMLTTAPLQEWETKVKNAVSTMQGGDFAALSTLGSTIESLCYNKVKNQYSSAAPIIDQP